MFGSRYIQAVRPSDLAYVAEYMRASDRIEVEASHGHGPYQALEASARRSVEVYAGVVGCVPVCIFGVGTQDALSGVGVPWMLGTDGIDENAVAFARASRAWIDETRTRYEFLANYVMASNEVSKGWLAWLGFDIGEPEAHGLNGELFCPFWMGDIACV